MMNTINLSQMDEITCSDCGKPLIAIPSEKTTGTYQFIGCRCNKEIYNLPKNCIMAGFKSGPMFFYKEKGS